MSLTPEQEQRIAHMTATATAGMLSQTQELHTKQIAEAIKQHAENSDGHKFIYTLQKREERRQEMWDKAKGNLLSYIVILLTGGTLTAAWQVFKNKVGS